MLDRPVPLAKGVATGLAFPVVAQMAECRSSKPEVAGSLPVYWSCSCSGLSFVAKRIPRICRLPGDKLHALMTEIGKPRSLKTSGLRVRLPLNACAGLAQLAEAVVSKATCCGFDSHDRYWG